MVRFRLPGVSLAYVVVDVGVISEAVDADEKQLRKKPGDSRSRLRSRSRLFDKVLSGELEAYDTGSKYR